MNENGSTERGAATAPECACPEASTIQRHFDRKTRVRLAAGEVPGLVTVSERLRDALLPFRVSGRTVLEAGCGRGTLLLELLRAGASRATGVDLSPASIEEARRRVDAAELSADVELSVGDAARVALEPHDWVILDRVMCCYPDVDALLRNTIPAARGIYAFSVPESRGWRGTVARVAEWFETRWNGMFGSPCPGYVHDIPTIERALTGAGFRRAYSGRVRLWHLGIFERVATA